jgi:hypothetical protein
MNEATAGGHPLDASCIDDALMSPRVSVGEAALHDEGDRLEAPMRVRTEGKAAIYGRVVCGP